MQRGKRWGYPCSPLDPFTFETVADRTHWTIPPKVSPGALTYPQLRFLPESHVLPPRPTAPSSVCLSSASVSPSSHVPGQSAISPVVSTPRAELEGGMRDPAMSETLSIAPTDILSETEVTVCANCQTLLLSCKEPTLCIGQ